MAEAKMFTLPRKVPKWAWYASAGVAAGGLIIYLRNRSISSSSVEEEGAVGTPVSTMPGIVVVPQGGATESPDAILASAGVPALQDTYLGAIAGVTDQLLSYAGMLTDAFRDQTERTIEVITGGGSGSAGSTQQPGGTVTVAPPPATTPTPPADPCVGMQRGGSAGNCRPAGAICRQMIGCGTNSNGHYCTWKFRFANGKANCYNNYTSGRYAGKCVGPFGCP